MTDSTKARAFFELCRWPDGIPVCPKCGVKGRAYAIAAPREGVRKCGACGRQFSVTVGTVFESSPLPLETWLAAVRLLCAGATPRRLQMELGVSYKSAWLIVRRLRYGLGAREAGGVEEALRVLLAGVPKR